MASLLASTAAIDSNNSSAPNSTASSGFQPLFTVPAVPYLTRTHEVALGVCFVPLALSIGIVILGSIIHRPKRRQNRTYPYELRPFTPTILRWQTITILLGVTLTSIGLLELSCHVLPSKSLRDGFDKRTGGAEEASEVHIRSSPSIEKRQTVDLITNMPDCLAPSETALVGRWFQSQTTLIENGPLEIIYCRNSTFLFDQACPTTISSTKDCPGLVNPPDDFIPIDDPALLAPPAGSAPDPTPVDGSGGGEREGGGGGGGGGGGKGEPDDGVGGSGDDEKSPAPTPAGDVTIPSATYILTSATTSVVDGVTVVNVLTIATVIPALPSGYGRVGGGGTEDFGTGQGGPPAVEEINTDVVDIILTRDYLFVGTMLPTLLAAVFSIPWKIFYMHLSSLDPFARMSSSSEKGGVSGYASVLSRHSGTTSVLRHALSCLSGNYLVFFAAIVQYLAAVMAPLAAEAISLALIGNCGRTAHGCEAVVAVSPLLARVMMGILAAIAFVTAIILYGMRRWSTGLAADPRSIAGIASLCQDVGLQHLAGQLPTDGSEASSYRFREELGSARFSIGMSPETSRAGPAQLSIRLSQNHDSTKVPLLARLEDSLRRKADQPVSRGKNSGKDTLFPTLLKLALLAVLLLALDVVIVYWSNTHLPDTAFEKFMASQSFGVNFLFAGLGVVISRAWDFVFQLVVLTNPYSNLSSSPQSASKSIIAPYVTDPYTGLVPALRGGRLLVAFAAASGILADFLPLLLANVPFNRASSYEMNVVSCYTSVAVLSLMTLGAVAVLVDLARRGPRWASLVGLKGLQEWPIAVLMALVGSSPELMGRLAGSGADGLDEKDRNTVVERLGLKYSLEQRVGPGGPKGAITWTMA